MSGQGVWVRAGCLGEGVWVRAGCLGEGRASGEGRVAGWLEQSLPLK